MHQTSVIFLTIITVQSAWINQFLFIYAQTNDAFEEEQDNELKAVYHGAPRIHPFQGDVEIEKGEDLILECESEDPITWRIVDHNEYSEQYKIRHIISGDADRPFKSTIEISGATANNVQRYYCVKNETLYEVEGDDIDYDDIVLAFRASSIYVFVKDNDQPLVPISVPIGHVHQYEEAFIPCKPSSKSVKVVLTKDESEIPIEDYHFSPMLGFIIRIQSVTDGGLYKCSDADGQTEEIYNLEVSETSLTQYISKPEIYCNTSDHATISGELDMRCDVEVAVGAKFSINWYLPGKKLAKNDNRTHISELSTKNHPIKKNILIGSRSIKIFGVSQEIDNGVFKCEVQDLNGNKNHNYHAIKVLDSGTGFIELKEESNLTQIVESTKRRDWAKIVIKYKAYPEAEFAWFKNHKEDIFENTTKYEITKSYKDITLTIRQLNINDTGNYTLKAFNGYKEAIYTMQVLVKDKPQVFMEPIYSKPNKQVSFVCRCTGYPESKMAMFFTPCHADPKWPTCTATTRALDNFTVTMSTRSIQSQIAEYPMIALTPGKVFCFAENSEGKSNTSAELLIGNQEEPVAIKVDQPDNVITTGDDIIVTCSALIYFHTPFIEWRTNNNDVIGNTSDITVINTVSADTYAYESKLIFKNIQESHKGFYNCHAFDNINGTTEEKDIEIDVMEPKVPELLSGTNSETLKVEIGDPVLLSCDATGTPFPKITWYKDDELIDAGMNETYENTNQLFLQFSRMNDTGIYRCVIKNKVGTVSKEWHMEVMNSGAISKFWIYFILIIILLLVLLITFITLRLIRARKYLREMKAAGLANFEEGDPDAINPEIALDEQADLLPYKKEFEFPRDKLKIGKQLGAGAFGVVMKATAEGIKSYEDETVVAVKMVKKQTDNEVMRALISELKIMVHLGHHLNVVNLLGAITKNIAKREVMVIVEYCRFGNVQNFLLKHRTYFIDQINSDTGEIDHSVQKNELRWSKSGYQFNRNSTKSEQEQINTKGYIRHSGMHNLGMIDSAGTEATYVGGEDTIPNNDSTEPAWRSNYRMDYSPGVIARSVTTTDLVSWAAQVASGMDYLASRKVLHGDLAARNILLCDDNVVKICDFGLARSMYKTSNYKKKSEVPLPFKWLALECISDSVFSTYSDIWAYGIVLWELFSLAKIPYPGMEANEQLYQKLRDGYRMEKPQFANQDIYDIMLNCWNVKPDTRPSFKDLKSRFEAMLPEELRNHYLDLNEPYLAMNTANIDKGEVDYLANLGPPQEKAPAIPDYVNGIILPLPPISEYQNSSDYLKMSSPKQDSESNFDFSAFNQRQSPTLKNNLDNSPHNLKRHKKSGIPEEIPMLNTSNLSNSDSEPEMSPTPAARISQTPEYQQTNQYVNVKPVRDAFANPSYVTFNKVNEKKN